MSRIGFISIKVLDFWKWEQQQYQCQIALCCRRFVAEQSTIESLV